MPLFLNQDFDISNLTRILTVIGIIIGACLGAFLFIMFLVKTYHLHSLKPSKDIVQTPELIKEKFFIAADGYQLHWQGRVQPNGKKIVLAIHDLAMTGQNFESLQNYFSKNSSEISVITYDQRNFGKNAQLNKRNLGDQVSDLKAIVKYLQTTYPNQEIILLAEGKAFELARYVLQKDSSLKRLVAVGIRNYDPYQQSLTSHWSLIWGRYFKTNKKIPLIAKSADLSTNQDFQQQITENLAQHGVITVGENFQWKRLANYNNRHHLQNDQKILVLQPQNDFYTHPKKTTKTFKLLAPNQLEIHYFPEQKHFLLNEPEKIKVYELLNNWL